MSLKHLSAPSKVLAASITAAATSFKLNNIKGWDDVNLTSADFGSQAFAVIRNANNTILELIEFDPSTIASASITILRRGLKFTGDLTTEVAANKLAWTKGDTFVDIGVDTPQMYQWLQEYVDAAIVAGGVPATTSVLGLAKASVAPASAASPIFVGDNDPRMPTADENNAMAGGGTFGTPSTSNKFVTEDKLATKVPQQLTYNLADSPATWTKDTGLLRIKVQLWAGGASGALSAFSSGEAGGGGGGGYAEYLFEAAVLGATETVTIGAGGVARTTSGNGNVGGNTTFGSLLTAYGGGGGEGNTSGGAYGGGGGGNLSAGSGVTAGNPTGLTSAGNVAAATAVALAAYLGAGGGNAVNGGASYTGGDSFIGGAGGGGATAGISTGSGGTSKFGGNGGAGDGGASGNATAGAVPGGGGGAKAGVAGNSGAGGAGRCIITEYYS